MISASIRNRASMVFPVGILGLDDLQRDLPLQLAIAGHPDLADPAPGMGTDLDETPTLGDSRRLPGGGSRLDTAHRQGFLIVDRAFSTGGVGGPASVIPSVVLRAAVPDLRHDLERHLLSIPRIQAHEEVVIVTREMGRGQALEGIEAFLIENPLAQQQLGQRLLLILAPGIQRRGKAGARDHVGEEGQDRNEQITIRLVHDNPLRLPDRFVGPQSPGTASTVSSIDPS